MKKILLILLLTTGIFPYCKKNKIGFTISTLYAQDYSTEQAQAFEDALADAGLDRTPLVGPGDSGYSDLTDHMQVPYDVDGNIGIAYFQYMYEKDDYGNWTGNGSWQFIGTSGDNPFGSTESTSYDYPPNWWGYDSGSPEDYDPETDPYYYSAIPMISTILAHHPPPRSLVRHHLAIKSLQW